MNNQRLIIRISPVSLLFSTTKGGEIQLERYALKSGISQAANMREALDNVPLLQEEYGHVTAMIDCPILLMSIDQFNENEQETLYRYTFPGQEQQAVMHYVVPNLNVVAIFSIHKALLTVLNDNYEGRLRIQPIMVNIWGHMYQKNFTGPRQKLYGYFHDRQLDIFAFAQNRFKFSNSYPVGNNPNDALYYLLSVWKQLGLDPSEDELHLSGEMPERQQLKDEATRFVKRVYINNPSGEFNRAPVTQIAGMTYDLMVYYMK